METIEMLNKYDEHLTSNMDDIDYDVRCFNPDYDYDDCDIDWYKYMRDLWKCSIESFMRHYNIRNSKYITPQLDDLKRTFDSNKCVIDVWNRCREIMIDNKLNAINGDFQQ